MTQSKHWVDAGNGVRLFAKTWGDVHATPIILVHGYPNNHLIWCGIAEQLAKSFYVIAYDVRGAGQSTIPTKVRDYRLEILAQDLCAVSAQLIPNRQFHLVGHDWGSIQSWESVTTAALDGKILSYTTLSGPCLDHAGYWMRDRLKNDRNAFMAQMKKSWYIMAFQVPVIAPNALKVVGKLWYHSVEKAEGVLGLSKNPTQRSDIVNGVKLYRANFIDRLLQPRKRHAHCPVQAIILENDAFVGVSQMDDLHLWVDDLTLHMLQLGHWAVLSHAKEIAAHITTFAQSKMAG